MLQLKNSSPFTAVSMVFANRNAVDTLYTVVKATFDLPPPSRATHPTLADEQRPVALVDEHWGEPGTSSLKFPSEAHIEKPGTDVIVVGDACAPGDRQVTKLQAAVSVAGVNRVAAVLGDRVWERTMNTVRPSAPRAFMRMPLVYERSYGGAILDEHGKLVAAEPTNPVGCGFKGSGKASTLEGQPVPNIEDPENLLQAPGQRAAPVGFGAVAPAWMPRAQYAGTYDTAWQKTRAPYLPLDFDPRFFNIAPPGWTFPKGLRGGEPVVAAGMSPLGVVRFSVPKCQVSVTMRLDSGETSPPIGLETLIIEPTAGKLTMTWRAAFPCDKKVLKVREISVAATVLPS